MNTLESIPLYEQWFVGREEYLKEFNAWLHGERDYRVLFIHGPGGIGKTWLLRRMMAGAHKKDLPNMLVVVELIDLYSTATHSIEGVREHLITLLGESAFQNYRKTQRDIKTAEQEGFRDEILQNMRQSLRNDFLADCRKLSEYKQVIVFFDTFERVQHGQAGSWLLTELARELPNFRFVIASREVWGGNTNIYTTKLESFSSEETQLYIENREKSDAIPHMSISDEVLKALHEKTDGHPLRIELARDLVTSSTLLSLLQESDEVLSKQFSEPLLEDDFEEAYVQLLHGLSKEKFEAAIVKPLQVIGQGLFGSEEFNEPVFQTILVMAHFNRRFSHELLQLFVDQKAVDLRGLLPADVLKNLEQEFLFIKTRPDGFVQLHDEMERLVNEYLWPSNDRWGDYRRDLARVACGWYDVQIAQRSKQGEDISLDDLKAEQLVYWIEADPEEAYSLLQTYGYSSFALNSLLVAEIQPVILKALPIELHYRFATDLGDRARRVYQYERGQEYWKIAIETAREVDKPDRIIDALLGLHNCMYLLNLDRSLEILREEALPLCEHSDSRRAQVLYEIGFTLSRKQQYPKAIEHYEQAKEVAKDVEWMATILNDMGYTYVFLGEYKLAGRYVKRGLYLRRGHVEHLESLFTEKKTQQDAEQLKDDLGDARWLLGLSFNTLGQIKRFDGDLAAATGAYSEALEIFSRDDVQDFSWQARALHSRGEAHRRIARILFEQGRFEACNDYEKRARNDLQRCLDVCDQYGITEKHTAYRRMGRLLHDQAFRTDDLDGRLTLLGQAKGYFEKGFQAAKDDDNVLEELENLTEIAYLVDDRLDALKGKQGQLKETDIQNGDRDIESLRETVKQHGESGHELFHFAVFQHLLELEEGAFRFVQGKYDDALEFYKKGYVGLASERGYGVARYKQHLVHLFDQLEKLDQTMVEAWGETFIKTWEETKVPLPDGSELTLAQLHPELVEEMQIYLDTVFLPQE